MKEIIKMVVAQFFLITVLVLLATGVVFAVDQYPVSWLYPFYVLGCGFFGAVPSLVFYSKSQMARRTFWIRVVLHFVLLSSVIMLFSYLFGVYSTPIGALWVFLTFFVIYLLVWLITERVNHEKNRRFNEALKHFKEEEEKKEKK
jgi:hypothetical protein